MAVGWRGVAYIDITARLEGSEHEMLACPGLQEAAAAEESDEEDEFVYNPLKLPLGWDGKPIPYWLYKLHGLNLEFKCEICGEWSCS